VLLGHERLGGALASALACEARVGRGLRYETVAGMMYRYYEAIWLVRQQWTLGGGASPDLA
jgi:hypothetical protein